MDRYGRIAHRMVHGEIDREERVGEAQDDLSLVESWLGFLEDEDNPDPNDLKKAEKYLDDVSSVVNRYLGDRKLSDALDKISDEIVALRKEVIDMHIEFADAQSRRRNQLEDIQNTAKRLNRNLRRYRKVVK